MKGPLKLLLGIATSICGFIEVGSISSSAQAGAAFGFQLLWAIVLATICLIFLVEMSGRLACVSKHTLAAAVRERFGFRFQSVPLVAEIVLDTLVLTAEIGGVCVALQLVSAVPARLWAVPVGLFLWFLLWRGSFSLIENGVSALGLITLAFVVGAIRMHPPLDELARGLIPSAPDSNPAKYWFLAVSILGATISPYLLNFYGSGVIEDRWGEKDVPMNRAASALGMGFGSLVSVGVLVVAALALRPRGIHVDRFEQAALMLTDPFGRWGVPLFAGALAIGCFGAALEVGLNLAYVLGQSFGWNWGEDQKPRDDARFATVYTLAIALATLLMLTGIDPLRLTILSMALTVLVLPVIVFPFLVLMNDPHYVRTHRNGWIGNLVVVFILGMGVLLALVAIPLEIAGG